jgi:hypothetical protein
MEDHWVQIVLIWLLLALLVALIVGAALHG